MSARWALRGPVKAAVKAAAAGRQAVLWPAATLACEARATRMDRLEPPPRSR